MYVHVYNAYENGYCLKGRRCEISTYFHAATAAVPLAEIVSKALPPKAPPGKSTSSHYPNIVKTG